MSAGEREIARRISLVAIRCPIASESWAVRLASCFSRLAIFCRRAEATFRRCAKYGDGFMPLAYPPGDAALAGIAGRSAAEHLAAITRYREAVADLL
jgi:hypothetical protein